MLKNNQIVYSSKLSAIGRPIVKSLLHDFREFKKSSKKTGLDNVDKILKSRSLNTDEKVNALETISNDTQNEIIMLKLELEQKDKIIKDIMHKL